MVGGATGEIEEGTAGGGADPDSGRDCPELPMGFAPSNARERTDPSPLIHLPLGRGERRSQKVSGAEESVPAGAAGSTAFARFAIAQNIPASARVTTAQAATRRAANANCFNS